MDRSVGIVVPAFRPDLDRLSDYVHALHTELAPETLRIELDDPQPGVVDQLADLPADVNAVDSRRGKGAAVTAGFEAIDADVLAFADADGSTPASSIRDVVEPVKNGTADLAAGSRRHPDAVIKSHQTYARRWLGDGFAWFARRVLDAKLYDYQCGAKALTRDTWRRVRGHVYEPGFSWDLELIAMTAALGGRIVEVPVVWEDQPASTVDPVKTSLELAQALFASRHRAKLLTDDSLHEAIAAHTDDQPALVDRIGVEEPDD